MPGFGFHLPRFLRPGRSSHSRSPSSNPCNDVASDSSNRGTTPALESSPPSSTNSTPPQAKGIATATSHSTTPGSLTTDRVGVCQPSHVSRPATPTNAINLNPTPSLSTQNSISRPHTHSPHLSTSSDSSQHPLRSLALAIPSQQSSVFERQRAPPGKDLQLPQHQSPEIFSNAHNFTMTGPSFFESSNVSLMNNFNNFNNPNNFMKDLLKETILGAASDSSARDPPPRCHPGTRLAILERCLEFIAHCEGVQKMRWVVGAAGVGKSAIMQSVTESPKLSVTYHASVFLSINGRNEGTKTIITLSYQFAAKSQSYRQVIEDEINRDPSLLQSSMAVQFERFIIQTFIHNTHLQSADRILIIVDGLDECKETRTQVELLRLISSFCISYPSSPVIWLIASRPEPHIIAFLARPEVMPAYEKEEIAVDSDEARADVEKFLRHELADIGKASNSLDPRWPDETHLWKLTNAAGGLFAYAQTVVRYIGDSNVGDPASQLSDVLNVIDELPISDLSREKHPMALLDALYARILSNIPPKIMVNARKLLLALTSGWDLAAGRGKNLIVLCNWLAMTADEVYTALNRLRAVLDFPERHEAHKRAPEPFHKSFFDHLHRSGFSTDIRLEARQMMLQYTFRVLKEAPNGFDCDTSDMSYYYGILGRHSDAGDKISLSWLARGGTDWNDVRTRQSMYQLAIGEVVQGIKRGDPVFQTVPCIELLTTRFDIQNTEFPFNELCDLVFDRSRREELMECSILKQIPTKAINISKIDVDCIIKMRFRRPDTKTLLPDPWELSCTHLREGQYAEGKERDWVTAFKHDECTFCFDRLKRQLERRITEFPNHAVPIMFTSAYYCSIEVGFVDPEDGTSEWTYWLWLYLSADRRKELGSVI